MHHSRLLLTIVVGVPGALTCATPSIAAWITRNGDAAQTGHVNVAFDPVLLRTDWSAQISTPYPVAVTDGLFVISTGDSVRGLDATSGEQRWEVTGATFREPTIDDGIVYVPTGMHSSSCGVTCTERTYMRSYTAADGSFRFRTPFGSQWSKGWGPVPYDGSVYMNGGYYGGIYRFTSSGEAMFTQLAQYSDWAPAVDDQHVYAYVAGVLQVLDRSSMSISNSIRDPDYDWRGYSMRTIPVLTDNGDVIVRYGGRLMSFDPTESNLNWSLSESYTGQPVYADGVIYAVSAGALSALDEHTGERLWSWEITSDDLNDWMLLTDSHIFVQSDTMTHAIDLTTHEEVWSYPQTGLLAYDDDMFYIAGATVQAFVVVPEPMTAFLLLFGLAVVGFRRHLSCL